MQRSRQCFVRQRSVIERGVKHGIQQEAGVFQQKKFIGLLIRQIVGGQRHARDNLQFSKSCFQSLCLGRISGDNAEAIIRDNGLSV